MAVLVILVSPGPICFTYMFRDCIFDDRIHFFHLWFSLSTQLSPLSVVAIGLLSVTFSAYEKQFFSRLLWHVART